MAIVTGTMFDDSLAGTVENDQISGLNGNDILIGGAGADRLDGGVGIDTASYADGGAGVTASLATAGSGNDAGGDTYINIENLTGTAFTDGLYGDSGNNLLIGGGGADILDGRKRQ